MYSMERREESPEGRGEEGGRSLATPQVQVRRLYQGLEHLVNKEVPHTSLPRINLIGRRIDCLISICSSLQVGVRDEQLREALQKAEALRDLFLCRLEEAGIPFPSLEVLYNPRQKTILDRFNHLFQTAYLSVTVLAPNPLNIITTTAKLMHFSHLRVRSRILTFKAFSIPKKS